jgi:thiamine biosynthesis lipoprotein
MTAIESTAPTAANVGAVTDPRAGSWIAEPDPPARGGRDVRFAAMGTAAHVIVVGGPPGLTALAEQAVATLEARWSRFRPDSELCRINANPGRPIAVSEPTFRLVELAVRSWHLTGGRYDPTVLGAMRALGYDRSFSEMALDGALGAPSPTPGCADVVLDELLRCVTVPVGCGLDPGGIGKGFAADLVVDELVEAGARGVCVNIGGDLRVAGEPPEGGWGIGIADPHRPNRVACALDLVDGAVVTTTSLMRRWRRSGRTVHHIVDPRTGEPCESGLDAVTVVASRGWLAEVLAKAAFVSGPEDGARLLGSFDVAGVMFLPDGGQIRIGGLAVPA